MTGPRACNLSARMKTLNVIALMMMLAFSVSAGAQGVSTCLQKASRLADPGSRDRAKLVCLKKNPEMAFNSCLAAAKGFEYSGYAERAVSQCLFGKNSQLKAGECVQAARSLTYGMNRDDLLWSCMDQIGLSLKGADCRSLAKSFVYPYNRNRAASYCENEITNGR